MELRRVLFRSQNCSEGSEVGSIPIAKLLQGSQMTGASDRNRTHVRSLGAVLQIEAGLFNPVAQSFSDGSVELRPQVRWFFKQAVFVVLLVRVKERSNHHRLQPLSGAVGDVPTNQLAHLPRSQGRRVVG